MKAIPKKIAESVFKGFCLLLSGISVGWLIGLSVSPVIHIVITSLITFIVSITSALAGLKVEQDRDKPNDTSSSKRKFRVEVDPVPMMLVVVGLALGASLGVYYRANGWLGPSASRFVEQWKDTGLDAKDISRRLFDTLYPPKSQNSRAIESSGSEGENQSNTPGIWTGELTVANENSALPSPQTSNASRNTAPKEQVSGKANKPAPVTQRTEVSSITSPGLAPQYFAGVLFNSPSPSDCDRFLTTREERLNEYLTNYKDSKVVEAANTCNDNVSCLKALVRKLCAK